MESQDAHFYGVLSVLIGTMGSMGLPTQLPNTCLSTGLLFRGLNVIPGLPGISLE